MCDRWMPTIKLGITWEQFQQLPRNPAYNYEYVDGQACLTPRTRHYHALLDLKPLDLSADVKIRRVENRDFPELERLFAASFARIQPYGSLDDATRLRAATDALERTRGGGDGPWIERASFVALEQERFVGAIFITLLPPGDPCDWDSYRWTESPPADWLKRAYGRPHLTWIFVSPLAAGHGTGTTLLAAAVRELLAMGYKELASTFIVGNDSSMLWHWRNGFRLLSYPTSHRRTREKKKR